MRHLFFLVGTIFFLACSAEDKKQDQHVYWINSTKASCIALAPTRCLQIQRSETLNPSTWESFHGSIQGFEYQEGYIYKIIVKENHLDPADLPADASSIEYTLVEILEKRQDLKLRINDIWIAIEINGDTLVADTVNLALPQLEINVGDMRYMGNDACNQYNGGIIELDDQTIRFGIAAGTRMMCMDMRIPDLFNASLPEVNTWEIEENNLKLFDADGKEVMVLKKID
jgi:heat shock protein HslJ